MDKAEFKKLLDLAKHSQEIGLASGFGGQIRKEFQSLCDPATTVKLLLNQEKMLEALRALADDAEGAITCNKDNVCPWCQDVREAVAKAREILEG